MAEQFKVERLQNLFDEKENNLVLLYGRSGLNLNGSLDKFLEGKRFAYYRATECSNLMQQELMAEAIRIQCDSVVNENDYFTMFNRIRTNNADKFVLVIDNVENIMKKDPDFFVNIEKLRKHRLYQGPIMILLMTSSLVFAENYLPEKLKGEYSKFDAVLKISELNFLEVVRIFPEYSVSKSLEVYGVLGGVPEYLALWDKKKSLKQNICDVILNEKGPLYNEAHNYLAFELREYGVYQTILAAIASGKEKLNDLFVYTGYSRPKISVYMKNLMEFEVIEKVSSIETGGWDQAKKGIYRIKNTYLNFYYKFVFPNLSFLRTMGPEAFYDKFIMKELERYLDRTFVKVCGEFLELSSSVKQLPIEICKISTWEGKNGVIDIVAQDSVRHTIAGKCSWSDFAFTYAMYEELQESLKAAKIKADYCYLFSAKRFEPKLTDAAKNDPSIVIVDMNEM